MNSVTPIVAARLAFDSLKDATDYTNHIESYRIQFYNNPTSLNWFNTQVQSNLREALFTKILGYVPKSNQFQIWTDKEGSTDERKFGFLVYSENGNVKTIRFEATVTRIRDGEKVVEFEPTSILCKTI